MSQHTSRSVTPLKSSFASKHCTVGSTSLSTQGGAFVNGKRPVLLSDGSLRKYLLAHFLDNELHILSGDTKIGEHGVSVVHLKPQRATLERALASLLHVDDFIVGARWTLADDRNVHAEVRRNVIKDATLRVISAKVSPRREPKSVPCLRAASYAT